MKLREQLNNDGNTQQAIVWEHANQIIVRIYDTDALHNAFANPKQTLTFNTIQKYENWLSKQNWVEPQKRIKGSKFKKIPKDNSDY